jgi:uncharacterized protein (TIGR00725 family)
VSPDRRAPAGAPGVPASTVILMESSRPAFAEGLVPLYVGVVGDGGDDSPMRGAAEEVGRRLAARGAVVVCGGLGGVMAAACRGAMAAGGLTIGLLPGDRRAAANPWVAVALPTGLGELRNGLVVRASDVLVALGGGYGTLSEIALALKTGCPVVGLSTFAPQDVGGALGVVRATDPAEAVQRAVELGWRHRNPAGDGQPGAG